MTAIQMVTINCAQCFQMDHDLGSIAPGKCADIVFLDDLEDLRVTRVLIDGDVVAEDGRALFDLPPFQFPDWVTHSMHLGRELTPASFEVPAPEGVAEEPCGCARSRSSPPRSARSRRMWTCRSWTAGFVRP